MELVDLEELYKLCKQREKYLFGLMNFKMKNWRNKFKDLENVYLTPDYGWMTNEAQQKLREITLENIECYLEGKPQNKI